MRPCCHVPMLHSGSQEVKINLSRNSERWQRCLQTLNAIDGGATARDSCGCTRTLMPCYMRASHVVALLGSWLACRFGHAGSVIGSSARQQNVS